MFKSAIRHGVGVLGLLAALGVIASPVAAQGGDPGYVVPHGLFLGEARGPYRTGTYEELWVADRLPETRTLDPNDRTHLMVRIWYPAVVTGTPKPAPYALHPELYIDKDDHWLVRVKDLPTNSVLDAPVAPTPARFPILLYNHGGGNPNFSATFQTEFLASHGYVVVSIGHPGWDGIRNPYPDGYRFKRDTPQRELSEAQKAKLSELEQYRWMWEAPEEHMDSKRHTDDISYVIDQLTQFDRTPDHRFHQRLDLTRIGSLGWSIGGATSLQAAAVDSRIRAAINQDGWMYGRPVETNGIPVPAMIMSGGLVNPAETVVAERRALLAEVDSRSWVMLSRTDSAWYKVAIGDAQHGHFSDVPLFGRPNPSSIHPRLAHTIINAFSLEFFNRHLLGMDDAPLLTRKTSYREAFLTTRREPAPARK